MTLEGMKNAVGALPPRIGPLRSCAGLAPFDVTLPLQRQAPPCPDWRRSSALNRSTLSSAPLLSPAARRVFLFPSTSRHRSRRKRNNLFD